MMKISIIIPVYKAEKYIERCVRSLFEQTLDELEYIFVDDCSPDGSIAIIERLIAEYPERKDNVHIITHEKNKGLSIARNSGSAMAKGEYIAYCDSDDWVDVHMYELLYESAVSSCAELVYCDFYKCYEECRYVLYKTVAPVENKVEFIKSYMNSFTSACNLIAKRKLLLEHNLLFPENTAYREDFCFTIPLYYYAKTINKVDKALYFYNKANEFSLLTVKNEIAYKDEIHCDLEILEFFSREGVLDHFKEQMSWLILRDKQDLILDSARHDEFMTIYPEAHRHIWSCPFLNFKMKLMMWLVVNHMSFIVSGINVLRAVLKR